MTPSPPSPDSVEQIARKLTKSGRRALVRIGAGWTHEGHPGPSRDGAYTLGWGRDAKYRLIEKNLIRADRLGRTWAYRLTARGQQVAHILASGDSK